MADVAVPMSSRAQAVGDDCIKYDCRCDDSCGGSAAHDIGDDHRCGGCGGSRS